MVQIVTTTQNSPAVKKKDAVLKAWVKESCELCSQKWWPTKLMAAMTLVLIYFSIHTLKHIALTPSQPFLGRHLVSFSRASTLATAVDT